MSKKLRYIRASIVALAMMVMGTAYNTASAQATEINVTGTVEVADNLFFNYKSDLIIYVFSFDDGASKAKADLEKNPNARIRGERYYADDYGAFNFFMMEGGSALIWSKIPGYEGYVITFREAMKGTLKIKLVGKSENKKSMLDGDNELSAIVVSDSLAKRKTSSTTQTVEKGDTLEKTLRHPIHFRAKSNMRIIAQPVWYDRTDFVDEDSDTIFCFGKPASWEGFEYNKTQFRRMDYNWQHDSLHIMQSKTKTYVNSQGQVSNVSIVEEGDSVIVYVTDALIGHDPEPSHPYPFGVLIAISDYNTNYHYEEFKDGGERRSPLKFLDFSYDRFLPDYDKFKEKTANVRNEDEGELKLNFEVGKATIIAGDSMSNAQLNAVRNTIREIENDPSGLVELTAVIVYGEASPDGNEESNRKLAEARANYAINEIKRYTSNPRIVRSGKAVVKSWEDVAELMEKDGLVDDAKAIRDVIAMYPKSNAEQFMKIRSFANYKEVIEGKYLKQLRKVRYTYKTFITGQPEVGKIIEEFNAGSKYMNRGKYWALMDYYKDDNEMLEKVARKALEDTRETDKSKEEGKHNDGYWVYPATVLASCYIARDTADYDLLKPFLKVWYDADSAKVKVEESNIMHEFEKSRWDNSEYRIIMYTNQPEVAANQLIMAMKGRNREEKRLMNGYQSLIEACADTSATYRNLLMFSKCMQGRYIGDSEEANDVRTAIASTGVINNAVIKLAIQDKKEDKLLLDAVDVLPDDAKSDYLRSIIMLRNEMKSDACQYLASSFLKDMKMFSYANNDADLICEDATSEDGKFRAMDGAFMIWKDSIKARTQIVPEISLEDGMEEVAPVVSDAEIKYDESHPFTWYSRGIDAAAKGNTDDARSYLFKCFDMDKDYMLVLNVAMKRDKTINNKKELVDTLKALRKEYKDKK